MGASSSAAHRISDALPPAEANQGVAVIGVGSVWFAIAQAACASTVFLKSIALVLGVSTLSAATTLELFHSPGARLVLVTFAISGAFANLYVVWNTYRLRRNPAAKWRIRPMTASEKRRVRLALVTALMTFAVLGVEIWAHLILHPNA
jgi:hypothetical protein